MNTEMTANLIDRYFDGRASRQEQEELGRLIAGDGETAAEFVRASRMQATLEQQFSEAQDRGQARLEIAALLAKRERASQRAAKLGALQIRWQRWRTRGAAAGAWLWQRPAIAGAAAILVVGAAFLALRPANDATPALAGESSLKASLSDKAEGNPYQELDSAAPAPMLARDVKRKLRSYFLPGVDIAPLPIEDALALLTREFESVATRHSDPSAKRIALRLGDKLGESDPRRQRLVSLASGSISTTNALQLLAGQAGLTVAYVDGAAELRPRLPGAAPLRSRTFDVPEDFLTRVGSMFAATGNEINPLSMLSYQPNAGSAAHIYPDGQGMAKLSVQATPDDLRSINALVAMMKPGGGATIALTSKVIDLPAETLDELHATSATRTGIEADIFAAIAGPFPADQIIADPAAFRQLLSSINKLPGADILTMPSVVSTPDESVYVGPGNAPVESGWVSSIDTDIASVVNEHLAATRAEFEDLIMIDQSYSRLVSGASSVALPEVLNLPTFEAAHGHAEEAHGHEEEAHNHGEEIHVIAGDPSNHYVKELVVGDSPVDFAVDVALSTEALELDLERMNDIMATELELASTLTSHSNDGTEAEVLTTWLNYPSSNSNGGFAYFPQPANPPGYASNMVARLEGEAVRVSGTMSITAASAGPSNSVGLEALGVPRNRLGVALADVDNDGAADLVLNNATELGLRYLRSQAAATTNEVEFDATIAEGQTLLLEIDGENGGKQIVFLTAEKR